MSLKLKAIVAISFMAGELVAYAISASPWSPINVAEASTLKPPSMLVSDCAMPRTSEVIRLEQIMASMNNHSPAVQMASALHLVNPEPRQAQRPAPRSKPRPQRAVERADPVATLIAGLE